MKIVMTQPYLPKYRVPLMEELRRQLSAKGHEFVLFVGRPSGGQAVRNDAASAGWVQRVPEREVRLGSRTVRLRRDVARMSRADLFVTELDALNNLAWVSLLRRKRKTVLWGHGKTYVKASNSVAVRLRVFLAKMATHVVTYSESGRAFLIEEGNVSGDRVTAIGNATDALALRRLKDAAGGSRPMIAAPPGAVYIGGLDADKRISFLLDALRAARRRSPGFHLTVVGDGVDRALVQDVPGLRWTPEARGAGLVEAVSDASAIWCPGRVGLLAIDAIALRLPVHTTRFPYHAPEVEELRTSEVCFLPDDPEEFAKGSLAEIAHPTTFSRDSSELPSVEQVAGRMCSVIEAVLRA